MQKISAAASLGELEVLMRGYEERKTRDRARLRRMTAYAEGMGCRMTTILDYFGQAGSYSCGLCDGCLLRCARA